MYQYALIDSSADIGSTLHPYFFLLEKGSIFWGKNPTSPSRNQYGEKSFVYCEVLLAFLEMFNKLF